ncbi:hypothetical protein MOX02_49640 [Methylobacterium oxalidis]|uniref:Uncharacterized protein n=1 Tax=Methylobacterium oxalidis TaxID=944322 RepID=A0A512JAF0_9HYPH|nr:hypothetical protein MOX02_49640 [Methylobacterium oxalidis]GLS64415.1 hypothetical protein GCM10007888_27960 [Methylobacterium oxalidis]
MAVPFLSWPIVNPLPVGTFEVQAPPQRGYGMSDIDDPFTNEQLTELALMQAENTAQAGKALAATAHQAIAGLVMNALLMHELERLGFVDTDTLRAEAVERALSIQPPQVGASVARVIKTIFDGEAPAAPGADLTTLNNVIPDGKH